MNVGIPEHLKSEQQAVETQIRAAFRGTRRAGGVSWSESHEVDNYEGQERREAARAKGSEDCREDLIDDPNWDHETGVGGFNFVDAIGYTYYIAPAMVRCSRRGESEKVPYALTIEGDFKQDLVRLIDGRRARAVARFFAVYDHSQ